MALVKLYLSLFQSNFIPNKCKPKIKLFTHATTSCIHLLTCNQWQLMTMIHGGAATSPNKDFLKTKHHHIFLASQFCYDVRHLSFYEPIM